MTVARYDSVADFYEATQGDSCDDPATAALLAMTGDVTAQRVLDLACGQGRVTRRLADMGAEVTGTDLSGAMLSKAMSAERLRPRSIRYVQADAGDTGWLLGEQFDIVTCNFGLSDIDDLDGALASVGRLLRPGGQFVFSILHPCFPGGPGVSGAWPSDRSYQDEGWWCADSPMSALRRQVGASHRMLSSYLNALRRSGFWLDAIAEPGPPPAWVAEGLDVARFPVFLVIRCLRPGQLLS
jgi:SAM-dependent methyltransferase